MFRLVLILLASLALVFNAFGQANSSSDEEGTEVFRCAACGKPITKTAAVVDGKLYHPECFRCAACDKPIEGEYLRGTDGKYYHPACLERIQNPVCAYCGKLITSGKYITYEGKAYHNECYRHHVAHRCDVCGKPLEGSYITDYWGNRFHPCHTNEYPICAVCGRLVWQDKIRLDDERWLCPVCARQSVTDPEHARRLLEQVREELASMGIVVKTLTLRIDLVDNPVLAVGREPDKHSHTFGHIYWKEGYAMLGDENAIISVLGGLPEDLMRGIIAHELMHAWQHENSASEAPLKLREGSANWASSLIYSRMHSRRGQFFLDGLEKSDDPIYGKGYREVTRYADRHGIPKTLKMLKQGVAEGNAE